MYSASGVDPVIIRYEPASPDRAVLGDDPAAKSRGVADVSVALRNTLAVVALLTLVACTHGTTTPGAANECGDMPALPAGNLLLFGEMHGSVETPAMISTITCSLSRSHKVAVGLEIPSAEQPRIDAYLASRGTKADERALAGGEFWQRGWDGRSSTAMLRLIEDVRRLKQGGAPVDVFAFDDQPGTNLQRDVAIAGAIRRFHVARPDTQIVALMGNIHASQAPMVIADRTIVPSGQLLADLRPVSIVVAYPQGTIWACMPDCGVHAVNAAKSFSTTPGFREGASSAGYSHTYSLATITAAPPAAKE